MTMKNFLTKLFSKVEPETEIETTDSEIVELASMMLDQTYMEGDREITVDDAWLATYSDDGTALSEGEHMVSNVSGEYILYIDASGYELGMVTPIGIAASKQSESLSTEEVAKSNEEVETLKKENADLHKKIKDLMVQMSTAKSEKIIVKNSENKEKKVETITEVTSESVLENITNKRKK